MLKAAFLTGSVSRRAGGLFTSVRRLAQSLASLSGVEVEVFGVLDDKTAQDMREWFPLRPQVFGRFGPSAFGFAPHLGRTVERLQSDLVRVDGLWTYASVACLRWFRAATRPYVVAPRGMLDPWALSSSRWKKRLGGCAFENSHLRQAACLHALCEAEARSMRAYGLRNPICVIPNGIDRPSLDDSGKLMVDSPLQTLKAERPKVLLYLGRIHPKKGLVNLIRAWQGAQGAGREGAEEWVLAIAGWDQGGHEVELKRLASELGISWGDHKTTGRREERSEDGGQRTGGRGRKSVVSGQSSVVFLGPQFGEGKAACYRDCDAFILPSFSEGLPMVVLEAWAYAKPVLMTLECNLAEGFAAEAAVRIEQSANREAQRARCEARGGGSIEDGLRQLFAMSDDTRAAVGAAGRQLVATRFTWPKIAADMKAVYDWVLGGGPRPACVMVD